MAVQYSRYGPAINERGSRMMRRHALKGLYRDTGEPYTVLKSKADESSQAASYPYAGERHG